MTARLVFARALFAVAAINFTAGVAFIVANFLIKKVHITVLDPHICAR